MMYSPPSESNTREDQILSFRKGCVNMRFLGIAFNHNVLAVILGMAIVLLCLTISYLFQKKLFGKYRGKMPNAMDKKDRK